MLHVPIGCNFKLVNIIFTKETLQLILLMPHYKVFYMKDKRKSVVLFN